MILADITALPHHLTMTIPNEYLDIFEHMNVQYYLKIFNDSVFEMSQELGMTEAYFRKNQMGIYAVEQRLRYLAEVKAGETVTVYSRLLARSDKKLHFMTFMVNESTQTLSATMEALAFHVNRETQRSAPFLSQVSEIIDERLQEHQNLTWQVSVSEAIQL